MRPSGGVTFSLLHRPRGKSIVERVTVGNIPRVRAEARRRAQVLEGLVGTGSDPVERERDTSEARKLAAAKAARLCTQIAGRLTVRQAAEALDREVSLRWGKRYRQLLEFNLLDPTLPPLRLGIADNAAEVLSDRKE